MQPDEFETTLQRQPLRQVPSEWRGEILQAAHSRRSTADAPFSRPTLVSRLSTVLWPHPLAWASIAAAWAFIVGVNARSGGENRQITGAPPAPPSRQLLQAVREERRELARLIESPGPTIVEEPKTFLPRPRSERRREFPMV